MVGERLSSAHFRPDPWLSDVLDRRVFALASRSLAGSTRDLQEEMKTLAGNERAFFFAKIPTAEVRTCAELASLGFSVVDTAITLSASGGGAAAFEGCGVGAAKEEHFPAIADIAETCFRWSRFHLDPRIPDDLANRVKRRWMESYFSGARGDRLYSATVDGVVAGFLGAVTSNAGSRTIAVIDLVGVGPSHQGRGVGTALVDHFMHDWLQDAAELRVGTQAANIRSLRLYERAGFRVAETIYVLHAHYERGEALH